MHDSQKYEGRTQETINRQLTDFTRRPIFHNQSTRQFVVFPKSQAPSTWQKSQLNPMPRVQNQSNFSNQAQSVVTQNHHHTALKPTCLNVTHSTVPFLSQPALPVTITGRSVPSSSTHMTTRLGDGEGRAKSAPPSRKLSPAGIFQQNHTSRTARRVCYQTQHSVPLS